MANAYFDIEGVWMSELGNLLVQVYLYEDDDHQGVNLLGKSLAHCRFSNAAAITVSAPSDDSRVWLWSVAIPERMKESVQKLGSNFRFYRLAASVRKEKYSTVAIAKEESCSPAQRREGFLDLEVCFNISDKDHFSKVGYSSYEYGKTILDDYKAPEIDAYSRSIAAIWKIFLSERESIASFDQKQLLLPAEKQIIIMKHDTVQSVGLATSDLLIYRSAFIYESLYRIVAEISLDSICEEHYLASSQDQGVGALFDYSIFYQFSKVEDILNEIVERTTRNNWTSVHLPMLENSRRIFSSKTIEFVGAERYHDTHYSLPRLMRASRTLLICVGFLLCGEVTLKTTAIRDLNWLFQDFFRRGNDPSALMALEIMESALWEDFPIFCFYSRGHIHGPQRLMRWSDDSSALRPV
ncbi:hypothetical protein NKH49_05105 [Mesorhizobium sp. M1088]|uniref:hypothetical protein n=1 Tax=Mesorhizobium sp. M1088 TaxID=2957056 RepID=UPI00333B28EA